MLELEYEKIGKQIALLRKEKKMTGEKLAEILAVSPQAVSKWENGKCLPETALLPDLARILGCTIDALLMPRELLILEAFYTDGMEKIDVTPFVNSSVHNNQLTISLNPQSMPSFPDNGRLKILTLKYQTPEGTFCQWACQNDLLYLDLKSPGLVCDVAFKIVGAFYGNAQSSRSVMQKMKHYDYFQWQAIPVNHETFPSLTGSDDTEYLTLIYLNADGIHCISGAENETLYYSGNRTCLCRQDGSRCILPGIMRLNWNAGMDCTWAGALYAALHYMGESCTYEQIMGLSGACYRVCFTKVWDWSCTDALVAYDYASVLFQAIGYEPVWADRLEKAGRKTERQSIVRDIQDGKPVLAINLRIAPEWGVITGYLSDGDELLCRTYFDQNILDEKADDIDFLKSSEGYLTNDNWPFLILHFGSKKPAPSPRDNLITSLKVLAASFLAPPNRGYFQGREAYEAWIQALTIESDFTEAPDQETIARRLGVNDSMLLNLIDARRCAAVYLTESVPLLDGGPQQQLKALAGRYAAIAAMLVEFRQKIQRRQGAEAAILYNQMQVRGVSSPQLRREQTELLNRVLQMEAENVSLVQKILSGNP
ncbi:MAG: helix-turn-helix transcriptional regulator [Clostridiaceae bacterium]|nr:helix-turn-helix transcriptional regulator [Clostridiaceae bacterium]